MTKAILVKMKDSEYKDLQKQKDGRNWLDILKEGAKNKDSFTGKFFHTFKDGKIQYQGHVISRPEKEIYLVQYFDWIVGEPNDIKLVNIKDMTSWIFYGSSEEMRNVYSTKYKKIPEDLDRLVEYETVGARNG